MVGSLKCRTKLVDRFDGSLRERSMKCDQPGETGEIWWKCYFRWCLRCVRSWVNDDCEQSQGRMASSMTLAPSSELGQVLELSFLSRVHLLPYVSIGSLDHSNLDRTLQYHITHKHFLQMDLFYSSSRRR
jgi:hypothetical protein